MGVCAYCGKKFYKKHNRQVYCSKCKKFAYQDKNAEHQRTFRKRQKENGFNPMILGCKDVSLGSHRNKNFDIEASLVERQLKVFNLK